MLDESRSLLRSLIHELRGVQVSQQTYQMTSAQVYIEDPTDANWRTFTSDVGRTLRRVNEAIDRAIDYDASLTQHIGPSLERLHAVLGGRAVLLDRMIGYEGRRPAPEEVKQWMTEYEKLIEQFASELEQLQSQITTSSSGTQSRHS